MCDPKNLNFNFTIKLLICTYANIHHREFSNQEVERARIFWFKSHKLGHSEADTSVHDICFV